MSPYETLPFPTQAEEQVDRETLFEIGNLIVTAAIADVMLGSVLSRLVSGKAINEPADALSAGMDFRVKLAVARVLSHVLEGAEDRAEFVRICDRLQNTYQRRNDVAHCFPNGRRGGAVMFQNVKRDAKTGLHPAPKTLTAKQIRGWSHQLTLDVQCLHEILDRYRFPSHGGDLEALPQ